MKNPVKSIIAAAAILTIATGAAQAREISEYPAVFKVTAFEHETDKVIVTSAAGEEYEFFGSYQIR